MSKTLRCLVFGESGQVATALSTYPNTICVGRDQLDLTHLTSPDPILRLINDHDINAVLNAAAYTAVDKAEEEPDTAHALNETAPGWMAKACKQANIPFIHLSTDFVFNGRATQPYREDDATAPLSVYGESKLAGEKAVTDAGGNHAVVRTSWVFSETGNNFVKTMLRLAETRDELTIVGDQIGCPTPASAIAQMMHTVAEGLIKDSKKSGLYHFSGNGPVSWADFARTIFQTAEKPVRVVDIKASEYKRLARTPDWSVLDNSKIHSTFGIEPADWRSDLRKTVTLLKLAAQTKE